MSWQISKDFTISYAHRVFTQDLFTSGIVPKCRNIHGHDSHVSYIVESEQLTNNMVIDFMLLKPGMFKKLNVLHAEDLDHKLLISTKDPDFNKYKTIYPELKEIEPKSTISYITSSLFVIDFVPTAETLARFFYTEFKKYMEIMHDQFGIQYNKVLVNFRETLGTNCLYTE